MGRSLVVSVRTRAAQAIGIALLALVAAALGGCETDPGQQRICVRATALFAAPGGYVEIQGATPAEDPDYHIRIDYRSIAADGRATDRVVACAFAGSGFGSGRFDLIGIWTSHRGALSPRELFWAKRVLDLKPLGDVAVEATKSDVIDRPGPALEFLYLLQQLINALVLGSVYGLVAVSFTLVYGIIGKINFAFGEIYMIGAVGTVLWTVFFAALGGAGLAVSLAAVFVLAAATAGLYGWASERLVFRPLRRVHSHAPLIAAIGLVLFLQEYVRLLHTGRDFWLAANFSDGFVLAEADGFTLYASPKQLWILSLTLLVYGILAYIRARTGFGRAQRACADDTALAELLGVDVDRVVAGTFALGGVCAGIAGFIIVEYYGVANFFMGLIIGFKALTAAIVGGIGSVTGALWGAMILAMLEVFWSAYLDTAWKDVAVFGLLIVVLIFRPDGLLGVPRGRGD
ncbi:MAG: branched-chain amino acid ABC transporter permease [Alphaproteobacteria bacterium]|nr:branched-chain amino acid ABC transporter permease [Alphaproteobacteria bacterium]